MKTDRLIAILSILLQKDQVTAPELAELFEVSRRTINRDIDALSMAGIPIQTIQGAGGGIRIMEGYRVDRTVLTGSDMQAILAGLRGLDSVSGTNRYAQLMEKLSAGHAGTLDAGSHFLINLAAWNKTPVADRVGKIHGAIEAKRKIGFRYFAPSGESRRIVEPYDLVFEWSQWYVWGWCELRQDFRLFKLNRMTEIEVGESFPGRAVPYPELSTEKVFPPDYRVKAIIQPQYRWKVLEDFGADSFTEQEDGTLLFSFGFADPEYIKSWILSLREGIEVLEPAELREELRAFGEKLWKKYS